MPDSISLSVRFFDFSKKQVKNASDTFVHDFTVRGKKSGRHSSGFRTIDDEVGVDMDFSRFSCCFALCSSLTIVK